MRSQRAFPLAAALLSLAAVATAAPDAFLAGRVLDSTGVPLEGARVAWTAYRAPDQDLLDWNTGAAPAPLNEVRSDRRGNFRIALLKPASPVSLRITAAGLPTVQVEGPFDEDAAEDDIEIVVPLPKKVCGRITDEAGKPLVARVRSQAGLETPEDATAFDSATSAADGSFCLPASPAGEISLRIQASGFAPASVAGSSRTEQRIVLRRGGSAEGAVTDPSGKPVTGAIVIAGEAAVRTDDGGGFRFEALAVGLATFQVTWKDDLFARRDAVRIQKGEASQVNLRLSTSAGVAGVVVDEKTRKPLGRVRIAVATSKYTPPGVPPLAKTRTDSRGRFRLMGLVRREYQLSASRAEYLPTYMPVSAKSSAAETLRVSLVRSAAVTGRVVDEQAAPVSRSRVQLAWTSGRRAMFYGDPSQPVPSALTDEKGTFRLTGIPPGVVISLLATHEGFVPARRSGIVAGAGASKPLVLKLARGLEARGRVVNAAGEAVSGAEIVLTRNVEHQVGGGMVSGDAPEFTRNASSDAHGAFALKALEVGKYSAEVRHPAYATRQIPGVEVKAAGLTEWAPFVLSPSALVAGTVRNARGTPVVGATVWATGSEGGYSDGLTDADGRFRLSDFAAGAALSMTFEAEGYALTRQTVKAPAPDLAIVMTTAGVIRGRVEDGETHQPLTAFTVGWRVPRGYTPEKHDIRSEDGAFEVGGVTPGRVEVTASAPGYLDGSVTGIEIAEGEVKDGLVVSLKKGRVVTGRVLDPDRGKPVANATVSWRRPSEAGNDGFVVGPSGAFAFIANSATSDADGHFEYDAVPPERLIFKASHPDFLDAEKPVDAASESVVEITLAQGGVISGTVVASDGRSPVVGAQVALQVSGATPMALSGDETHTDDGGSFTFPHLKEGRYRLAATSSSGRSAKNEVVLSAGQSADRIVLQMASGATLRGTVTGLPPEKLAGLEVRAHSESFSGSATTGPGGEFAIADAPPGVVAVSAWTAYWGIDSRSASKNVEVPEGATEVPVELQFTGNSKLDVHVTRGSRPLAGIGLYASPDPPSAQRSQVMGETDADGRAVLFGLDDGAYVLNGRSYAGGGGRFERQVSISGDTSLEVALGQASISGTVTDATSGDALAEVSISAETGQETTQSQMRSGRTDSQGFYTIDNLDPGDFQVTARRDGYKQKTQSLTVGDSPEDLPFKLTRGGGLTVVATDGLTGLPLTGLNVLAFTDAGTVVFSGSVSLDSAGTGEIQSLAPGTYSLYVASVGYANRSLAPVQVPASPVAIALTPGGRLEVRSESPATARILSSNGTVYLISLYSLDGAIAISPPVTAWDHVAPGSYRLVVVGTNGEVAYPFTVTEGETARVEVR